MTIDDAANIMAKLVFTTSDPGSYKIHSWTKATPYERTLLKEFIYLKSYIAYYICLNSANSNNVQEVRQVTQLMLEKLNTAFKHDFASYGNTYSELIERFNHYCSHVEISNFNTVTREFIEIIGTDTIVLSQIGILDIANVIDETHDWMLKNLQQSQSGRGNSCYVATATYQNQYHPNVVLLRDFRDKFLRQSLAGRIFITFYYTFGPYMAILPEHSKLVRKLSKTFINRIVVYITKKYY